MSKSLTIYYVIMKINSRFYLNAQVSRQALERGFYWLGKLEEYMGFI